AGVSHCAAAEVIMSWQVRHQGSPEALQVATPEEILEGLRDGLWEPTDEAKGPNDANWVTIEEHPQFADAAAELEAPPRHREDETRLDMTALIDVCLVLLIFFMMTATYAVAMQKVVPVPTVTERGTRIYDHKAVKERMVIVQLDLDERGRPRVRV